MGTRHLIEVKWNGEIKVSQYGQWDGYLSGQGLTIAQFLHSGYDKGRFSQAVGACQFATESGLDSFYELFGDSDEWKHIAPHLSRDTGAYVLWSVYASKGLILGDEREFKNDSLCEYHYLIDLDKQTVTINGEACIPFADFTPELCKQDEETVFAKYALA